MITGNNKLVFLLALRVLANDLNVSFVSHSSLSEVLKNLEICETRQILAIKYPVLGDNNYIIFVYNNRFLLVTNITNL